MAPAATSRDMCHARRRSSGDESAPERRQRMVERRADAPSCRWSERARHRGKWWWQRRDHSHGVGVLEMHRGWLAELCAGSRFLFVRSSNEVKSSIASWTCAPSLLLLPLLLSYCVVFKEQPWDAPPHAHARVSATVRLSLRKADCTSRPLLTRLLFSPSICVDASTLIPGALWVWST